MSKDFEVNASSSIDEFFKSPRHSSVASSIQNKIRMASADQIPSGFVRIASDSLVRLSQQDFWKVGQDDSGFFIERLVDDEDGPVAG
jgi:hypothetical protein